MMTDGPPQTDSAAHLDPNARWRGLPSVVEGEKFRVVRGRVERRDGGYRQREVVVHPGAVVILPWLDDRTVVLIRNHRFAIDQPLWELPAGTLEPAPETPEGCAARELLEETGYRAGRIESIMSIYSAPGFCTELLHCFAAYDLEHEGQRLEATERITVHPLPFAEVMRMIDQRRIVDAKTLAVLLDADRRRRMMGAD
ncbi:MAG: NUDIX hydrolase [Phycisphaeraceae bacterium]|nr:NUDIX hydrolase [Phycisphaeraceae bacterium]